MANPGGIEADAEVTQRTRVVVGRRVTRPGIWFPRHAGNYAFPRWDQSACKPQAAKCPTRGSTASERQQWSPRPQDQAQIRTPVSENETTIATREARQSVY